MEVAGLAIGVASILGLLSTGIDVYNKIDDAKDHTKNFGILRTRLRNQRYLLESWATANGFQEADGVYELQLSNENAKERFIETLDQIWLLMGQEERLSRKYYTRGKSRKVQVFIAANNRRGRVDALTRSLVEQQSGTTKRNLAQWVVKYERKLAAIVDNPTIFVSDLSRSHYLRACFDEALRLSPPVGGTLWYELAKGEYEKSGPLIVDGHIIPPGIQLGVKIYSLHHNEDYFPDAFACQPERWLTDDKAALHRMYSAFAAFSTGPRGCAGKSMAYIEAGMVIAKVLWYFDFETASGPAGGAGVGKLGISVGRERIGEFQLYDGFTSSHDGPNLVFRTRGDYWKDFP